MITDYAAFVAHLKRTGRMKLLPKVLRELRVQEAREKLRQPLVEVASEGEAAFALKAASASGIVAKEARVNPSLVSGWRARAEGKLIDRSAKHALIDIYRRITV